MSDRVDKVRESLIKRGEKKFGESVFTTLDKTSANVHTWYSTGIAALDVACSGKVGSGLPAGRIVEIYGDPDVGKTAIAGHLLSAMQAAGGLSILIDTESTLDLKRAKVLGIQPERLMIIEELFIENACDEILEIIDQVSNPTGRSSKSIPTLIVWDTISGTASKKEDGTLIGESQLGLHARALAQFFRRVRKPLSQSEVTLVVCNQRRDAIIQTPYANERDKDKVTGGQATSFMASLRIKLKFIKKTSEDRIQSGIESRATIIKHKHGPIGTSARLVLESGSMQGRVSNSQSCLRTLEDWNVLKKSARGYKLDPSDKSGYSEAKWRLAYDRDDAMRARVHQLLEASYVTRYLSGGAVNVADTDTSEA